MSRHWNKCAKQIKRFWLIPALICIGFGSYWLTVLSIPQKQSEPVAEKLRTAKPATPVNERPEPSKISKPESPATFVEDGQSDALTNQRAVTFSDAESMRRFLENAGAGIRILGRIDSLETLLVGYDNIAALEALLDGSEETSPIFPVSIPPIEGPGAQSGAVALENGLLEWLGIEGDHSAFGKGITIAILDTGIADHPAFSSEIQRINLVPLSENSADLNGHGTAVASLIFSNNPLVPGVAPGATPLSIRIADDNGSSNSFLMAQGIIAAADAGAQIINISLGGYGKSAVVDKAVEYASARGSIIVAAAGNTGTEGVMQPAANPGVIAVGAVDARNQPMAFSTTGKQIAIAAPGYGVNVAYTGNSAARVSGTSFSGPIAAGVIAATASSSGTQKRSVQQAATLVMSRLKDVGIQGSDSSTGAGVPDMSRILNANLAGYYDASINSIYALQNNQLGVLVQNLGNETLINADVSITVNGTPTRANITTLLPGQTRLITVPSGGSNDLKILSRIKLGSGQTDQRRSNDSLNLQFKVSK
jgi:hypothetical protein